LIAVLLDSVIVLLACAVVDVWAFMKWGVVAGTELHITTAVILIGGSLSGLIVFLYTWLLEASFGCTLGKAMVGIGVVNNSGRSSLAASGIRNLLRAVDGLGFYLVGTLVAICSQSRRRIGDLCAGTYVIEGDFSNLAKSLAVLSWLAVLGGSVWALPHACNRPKPSQAPRHFGQVVIAIGRAENSLYLRAPHHGIDVSLVNGTPAENTGRGSDQEIGRASKLDDAGSIREVR
jgi:uncharacterized RDD family membrane protein YckC